jgi:cytochrome c oxidase subunit IV
MATIEQPNIKKYMGAYALLLVITAVQFLIGYRNAEGAQLVIRMLTFGVIEAIIIVLFMMNLSAEKRTFFKFVAYFMLFVLATMNMIWTDSFRLLLFRVTKIGPS